MPQVARVVAVLWAGFWTWFGLASGVAEGLDPLAVLVHTALLELVFGLLVRCRPVACQFCRFGVPSFHTAGSWISSDTYPGA